MAGVLVHAVPIHYPTLDQMPGQGPGCLCGYQKTVPPGDGPPPISLSSTGILTAFPHPLIRRERLPPYGSHIEKIVHLLAQGLEVVHELFHMHPYRHPRNRIMRSTPGVPAILQTSPIRPQSLVLPPGDQPGHYRPPPLCPEYLPPQRRDRPQGSPGQERRDPTAAPMDSALTPLKALDAPPSVHPPPLTTVSAPPRQASPPTGHFSALTY